MGRIRTIKPEFFRHEGLFEAELETGLPLRLAFAGLWTVCDREGRFEWKPRALKLDILPWDDLDFTQVLDALIAYGFIIKYTAAGKDYGAVPSWSKHQVVNVREKASQIPEIPQRPENGQYLTRGSRVADGSSTRDGNARGEKEEEGEEEEEIGGGGSRDHAIETDQIDAVAEPVSQTSRERILTAIGVDPISGLTGQGGRQLGTPADMVEVGKWRMMGLSESEILEVITEVMALKRDGPPATFTYFTRAMGRLRDAKAAPPPEPQAMPSSFRQLAGVSAQKPLFNFSPEVFNEDGSRRQ